ncbi:MAG TPA: hypothetical protein DEP35_12525 [Deltaproteobacteria bacterium]|nr:hypothetical protein [Deltaproteobacteria bacterium]
MVAPDDSARRAWLTGAPGVPGSRYPTDSGHGVVLAHPSCDDQKRNLLAAYPHLERCCGRNNTYGERLAVAFDEKGSPRDLDRSRQITRWADH